MESRKNKYNKLSDFSDSFDYEKFKIDYQREQNFLRLGQIYDTFRAEEKELYSELDYSLCLFQWYCLKFRSHSSLVKDLYSFLKNKYSFEGGYLGFYDRRYDYLSQKFSNDFSAVMLRRFNCKLVEYFCDYFFIKQDPLDYRDEIIKNYLNLSPTYIFKSFVILLYGYSLKLPLYILTSHLIEPAEAAFDIKKSKSLRQLKFSRNFLTFLKDKGLSLQSSDLFEICKDASIEWEKENSNWIEDYLISNQSWGVEFTSCFPDENGRCQDFNGIFLDHHNVHSLTLPEDHRFHDVGFPRLLFKNDYIIERMDSLLYCLGESLNFSNIVENYVRGKLRIPKIGEGQWVSELALLQKIRSLTNKKVIHQWSPDWLKLQRIDIGIPSLNIGIEYNGKQHYEPVDFFGGIEGFKKNLARDKTKRALCKKNGIKLLEIKYDMSDHEIDMLLEKNLTHLA